MTSPNGYYIRPHGRYLWWTHNLGWAQHFGVSPRARVTLLSRLHHENYHLGLIVDPTGT